MKKQGRTAICSVLARIAFALGATASLSASVIAKEHERTGWHGERMPLGMNRAETNGEYLWSKDQSLMVFVPAGKFIMGSPADGERNEQPQREIWLDAYYIDKYEVSWRQWKLSQLPFADHVNSRMPYPEPPDWGLADNLPVTNVNWNYALQYAEWAGKRLPTEAQWEKAARGTDGRIFPWGNEPPTVEQAVWKANPIADTAMGTVDCCVAGASPYGALNMAGNAYEWVLDYYHADFYANAPERNPVALEKSQFRSLRGGAMLLEADHMRANNRYRLYAIDRTDYLGLRTALPLESNTE